MTFTATYSPEDNKLRLYSVSRLDADDYARVKAAGFRWAPKQNLFVAPMWTPGRAALLEELAGEIGDEDTSLVDRAEQRAERFQDYRESRTADAESAQRAVAAIADGIPFGQPILVGHHSERHARKDAERIENGMRKAVKMWETANYWKARAAGALRHAKFKELPGVRARRIKTIEADKRRREREQKQAAAGIRAWGKLNTPGADGRVCDDALRLKRALHIANVTGIWLGSAGSLWSALEKGEKTPREAQLVALRVHGRTVAHAKQWIAHFEHRLTYERAMLEEQGATALLAPKGKSAKAMLPLCNYRAPEGLTIANLYHRGEFIHYPQVEMTQSEYSAISTDYKGTRVVGGSHRVRTTMQRHSLVCVFLTDAKVHACPAPTYHEPRPVPPPPAPRPVVERTRDENVEALEAMRASLKAGVQVVNAPQLFPTPAEVGRQVLEFAELEPGQRVLEPSAGTGALLVPLGLERPEATVVAVEVNHGLAEQLRRMFPTADVRCSDFLALEPESLGAFDRIIMNPPFEKGADLKHILHARRFLKPDGRLVAVCANGPRQRKALEAIALDYVELPEGSFKNQGTNVRTAIVVLEPPATVCETCGGRFDDSDEDAAKFHDDAECAPEAAELTRAHGLLF